MKFRGLMLIMLLVSCSILNAQTQTTTYNVHFRSDDYSLDSQATQVLDQVAKEYLASPYAEIELSGHTDSDAGSAYNVKLSQNRSTAVVNYLVARNVNARKVQVNWYGESKPVSMNSNDDGKALNRRVQLVLKRYSITRVKDLLSACREDYKQSFTISSKAGGTIKGKNGTTIIIPPNALTDEKGYPVKTEQVTIELEEYLSPSDAVFKMLSTSSNGKILESGGMFSVKAYANGQPLRLKQGQVMNVRMPSQNMQRNMELFTGVVNTSGITEWQPTRVPFMQWDGLNVKLPYAKLNVKLLESLLREESLVDSFSPDYRFHLPAMKQKPALPKPPKELKAPEEGELFNWFQRLMFSNETKSERIEKETNRRTRMYNARLNSYRKAMLVYEQEKRAYEFYAANLETTMLDSFHTWLAIQKNYHLREVMDVQRVCFNQAIERLISLSNQNTFTSISPQQLFRSLAAPDLNDLNNMAFHFQVLARIAGLERLPMNKVLCISDNKDWLDLTRVKVANYSTFSEWKSLYYDSVMKESPELTDMFKAVKQELTEKREKLGFADEATVSELYATTLSGFGTFNCDRFNNTPPSQMITLKLKCPEHVSISFYVHKMRSYIYATQLADGSYSISLPKNLKSTMIVVGFSNVTGPLFHTQEVTFETAKTINLEPRQVRLAEMSKILAKLGSES